MLYHSRPAGGNNKIWGMGQGHGKRRRGDYRERGGGKVQGKMEMSSRWEWAMMMDGDRDRRWHGGGLGWSIRGAQEMIEIGVSVDDSDRWWKNAEIQR